MGDHENYQYRGLQGSDAIRIIKLCPSNVPDAELQCELLHTSLTECEEDIHSLYTAISYVWGDVKDTKTILVDGKKLEITATLHSALLHIRLKNDPARLWADAICINQSDVEERNQQVRQMGAVYACASHTIIYFGSPTPEAELFLETLRQSNANVRKGFRTSELASKTCDELWVLARDCFLNQAWLSRIWVLQELLFSRDPWIQCGRSRCRWDDFCRHARSFHEKLPDNIRASTASGSPKDDMFSYLLDYLPSYSIYDIGATLNGLELLLAMERFRNDFYNTQSDTHGDRFLLRLMQARRALGVTDPRDMLYAHATIARSADLVDKDKDLVKVDYNRSCQTIYMDTAHYFFEKTIGCSILSFVEDVGVRREGLASWAPDWTLSQPSKPWISIHEWTTMNITVQKYDERCHVRGRGRRQGRVDWSIESDFTHAWFQGILANLGIHVGVVGAMSDEIRNTLSIFDMAKFFYNEYPDLQINTFAVGLDAYARFYDLLDAALGPGLLPDPRINFPPAKVPFFERTQARQSKEEKHLECRTRLRDALASTQLSSSTLHPANSNQYGTSHVTQYVIPNLVKDTLAPGKQSIFKGRRLTVLPDGRLALVPASTRKGDRIICLAGSDVPYVLRPYNEGRTISDASIHSSFSRPNDFSPYVPNGCRACQYSLKYCDEKHPFCGSCRADGELFCDYDNVYCIQDLEVEHYKLVGECFVEGLMMGWTVPELERWRKVIFAIH